MLAVRVFLTFAFLIALAFGFLKLTDNVPTKLERALAIVIVVGIIGLILSGFIAIWVF